MVCAAKDTRQVSARGLQGRFACRVGAALAERYHSSIVPTTGIVEAARSVDANVPAIVDVGVPPEATWLVNTSSVPGGEHPRLLCLIEEEAPAKELTVWRLRKKLRGFRTVKRTGVACMAVATVAAYLDSTLPFPLHD